MKLTRNQLRNIINEAHRPLIQQQRTEVVLPRLLAESIEAAYIDVAHDLRNHKKARAYIMEAVGDVLDRLIRNSNR